jgi:AbrB family looped-hinge helix DNA binding protein
MAAMDTTTLTSKGQITVPKSIRERLNIRPGDRIHFFVEDGGTVIFMPAKSDVRELKGILPKPRKPVSIEAMNEAIAEGGSKG